MSSLPGAALSVLNAVTVSCRPHTRFDRKLLGKLCTCAWTCIRAEVQRLLGRDDVVPGMIAAIQTHGELLHWHPHFHMLLTCGALTPDGEFLELPELDMARLEAAWQEAVFALYLAEGKIEPESWRTCALGSTAASAWTSRYFCPPATSPGIKRLVRYMTRCPFSLSRLVKVTETGHSNSDVSGDGRK